jgi:hypothetical protein
LAVRAGRQVMQALMEADVTELADPKGRRGALRHRGDAAGRRRIRQQAVDSWIPQSGWLAHDDRCERDELAGVAGVRRPV